MRRAFVRSLIELAEQDERVVLLTGDLGFMVLEPFAERFPDRFINAGVAEQNMLGVATGLADGGMIPYVYSIATFATLRPYEFIRNGAALHRLPVRIVGVGGGLDYGQNGITHWALEDIGVLRIQPEMTVIAPADARADRGGGPRHEGSPRAGLPAPGQARPVDCGPRRPLRARPGPRARGGRRRRADRRRQRRRGGTRRRRAARVRTASA